MSDSEDKVPRTIKRSLSDIRRDSERRSRSISDAFAVAARDALSVGDQFRKQIERLSKPTQFEKLAKQQFLVSSHIRQSYERMIQPHGVALAKLVAENKVLDLRPEIFLSQMSVVVQAFKKQVELADVFKEQMATIDSVVKRFEQTALPADQYLAAVESIRKNLGIERLFDELNRSSLQSLIDSADVLADGLSRRHADTRDRSEFDGEISAATENTFWRDLRKLPDYVRQQVLIVILQIVCSLIGSYLLYLAVGTDKKEIVINIVQSFPQELHHDLLEDFREVRVNRLRVREFPNTDSKIMHWLRLGQVLEILERSNGWSLVTFQDKTTNGEVQGWVASSYLRAIEIGAANTGD